MTDYQKWRDFVFTVTPAQVGISKTEPGKVYGVVMDVGLIDQRSATEWALSLSVFSTGEASLRPSVGGGAVGLGDEPKIAQIAKEIVMLGHSLSSEASPTQETLIPQPGVIQFFFLSTNGLAVHREMMQTMQTPKNPFFPILNRFAAIQQFADQIAVKR